MTYTLYIGNKRYSSWSMRPWVLLKALNIPFDERLHLLQRGQRQPEFHSFSPTGKVPCLHEQDNGLVVSDSLAIVEYIAEEHEGVWPKDKAARAFARCAASEMHSSFGTIRDVCSMNVALRIDLGPISEALQRDVDRLSELFKEGLDKFGGPFLAGREFTAADAFFAPIASRVKTYGLKLDGPAAEYIDRLFEHPAVQAWIQEGINETARKPDYEEACRAVGKVLEDLSK